MNGGRGWVAVVLAVGVALSIVALSGAVAYAESAQGHVVSTEAATLLSTALGAVVGALATYMGLRSPASPDDAPPEDHGGMESANGPDDAGGSRPSA